MAKACVSPHPEFALLENGRLVPFGFFEMPQGLYLWGPMKPGWADDRKEKINDHYHLVSPLPIDSYLAFGSEFVPPWRLFLTFLVGFTPYVPRLPTHGILMSCIVVTYFYFFIKLCILKSRDDPTFASHPRSSIGPGTLLLFNIWWIKKWCKFICE